MYILFNLNYDMSTGIVLGDAFSTAPLWQFLYIPPQTYIYTRIDVLYYTYRIRLIFFPWYGIRCDRIKYILFVVSVRRGGALVCVDRKWRVLLKKHLSRSCLHIMGLCVGFELNAMRWILVTEPPRAHIYIYIYNLQWIQYAITCSIYRYAWLMGTVCVCVASDYVPRAC